MSSSRARVCAIALGLACAWAGRDAVAQTRCAPIDGGSPALEAVDAETRLAFLRGTMDDQASRASTWTWGWTGIGFGLAAAQYALVAVMPPERRVEQAFEATAAFTIPGAIAVLPQRVGAYRDVMERMVARASTPHGIMAPCLVLARAEELFSAAADDEAAHTGVVAHVLAIGSAGAYAAIIAGLFRYVPGVILGGAGALVVNEAQVLTAPRGAISARERYRRGELGGVAPAPRITWSIAPLGVGTGLAVVGRF